MDNSELRPAGIAEKELRNRYPSQEYFWKYINSQGKPYTWVEVSHAWGWG